MRCEAQVLAPKTIGTHGRRVHNRSDRKLGANKIKPCNRLRHGFQTGGSVRNDVYDFCLAAQGFEGSKDPCNLTRGDPPTKRPDAMRGLLSAKKKLDTAYGSTNDQAANLEGRKQK